MVLPTVFASEPTGAIYVVTMTDPVDAAEAQALATVYGGTLDGISGGRTLTLRISATRADMLRRDPHVVSVVQQERHLRPQSNGSGNVKLGDYSYDGVGNITAVGQDQYVYDALSRLTSATAAVTNGQTYTYDAFGNRTTATSSGALCTGDTTCGQSGTYDANNHLTNNGALYDPAGDLIAYGADKYAYDAAGMLSRSLVAGIDKQYLYTAVDERVAVYDGAFTWRWTVRGEDGKVLREFTSTNSGVNLGASSPQWVRDYIWREGLLLATENQLAGNGETTYHYHLDHLGTPRLVTDRNGVSVSTHTYHAFGTELKATTSETPETSMKFTGHDRDITGSSDALDDMHARYYSALQGRFLSPDPVLGSPQDPQSWNRYAYAHNNPLRYTDPDGRCSVDGEQHGWIWCAAHAIGITHTLHEQAAPIRQRMEGAAAHGTTIWRDGKQLNPTKMSDKEVVDVYAALQEQSRAENPFRTAAAAAAVPFSALSTLREVDETGSAPVGHEGGRQFMNDGRNGGELLPRTDANGNQITYREWDIHARQPGVSRGAERIVTGSDGSAWYTDDHYTTFIRIR
jgi:RHS repeat-associated protein